MRGERPTFSGDGKARTKSGEILDLELYKFDTCPYCQRVFDAIARLEVPVRLRDIKEDESARRKLLEVGGDEQVPCLFVNGKPLYESQDIIAFLEKNFG